MKLNYTLIFMALIAMIIFTPAKKIYAQSGDTLVVEWLDSNQEFVLDALRIAIESDTANGTRANLNRVYKLRRGGYYWITETITNNGWPLRIVGEDPDPNDPNGGPAVIQRVARGDGTVTSRIITGGGDITFKNLYFLGCDDNGVQGDAYQPVQIDAGNSRFVIDHCIFERTNFALVAWTGSNNDIFLTNNVYRNLVESPATQQWAGRGVSIWADQDTVVVENNTFFNNGFTAFQLESGAANYLLFNHNTFVNIGRGLNATPWLYEAYFANNLIINGFWHGEGYADIHSSGRDPRSTTSGMFSFGALPSKYGPEEGRRILFANSAAWLDPGFKTFYADTIRAQPFVGPVLKEDFIDKYDNIVVTDTSWLSDKPNFPVYPTTDILDSMNANIQGIRAGSDVIPLYFWMLPATNTNTSVTWPLPEDFSYSTPANLLTAGTDGLPLGDLNWFPNAKATYLANRDVELAKIKSMAGPIVVYNVKDEVQAEDATVGGDASILVADGTKYYHMSNGFIEWTFDLATAGQYDINVLVDLNGRQTSGVNFFVNGNEIHDPRGWGQYVFGNDETSVYPTFPSSGLNWWLIKQGETIEFTRDGSTFLDLPAGTNTIQIKASWCDNLFGGLQILEAGTANVVKDLGAEDVTNYSVASPGILGAPWTPQWFKGVALGTNGNITMGFNAPTDGDYVIQPFYQNFSGESSGKISVDGTEVGTFNYATDADSVGLSNLSDAFTLTTGSHQIMLSGSNVQVDYVQLIQKTVVTGINDRNVGPNQFSLSQNYPNPFNPTTTINFNLAKSSNVNLSVYNILGQRVAQLVNGFMDAGKHSIKFNASNFASGVYIYRIEAGNFKANKKMVLLK